MSIPFLHPDLQTKSETELNEKPERLQEDLKHIRDWLALQPHINARTDEHWILNFLRGSKFSLQRAKEKLELFYTLKSIVPEFYANRDPLLPEMQEVLKLGLLLPLRATADPSAPRVIYMRLENVDPSKVLFVTAIKATLMILDILINEDYNFIIAGQQVLVDVKGAQISHTVQITPNVIRKLVMCLQNAYPTRPQGIYCINTPSFFATVLQLIKPLLADKIKNRYFIYNENNLDTIYKNIPRSILPKEYGGEGDTLDELTEYWKKKVESYRDWFLEDAQYHSYEKLRPGKPYSTDEVFGAEGSFRKMDID